MSIVTETALDRVERLLFAKTGSTGKNHQWLCPAHDDSSPSLTVTHGDRGVILCCHRGCTANEVAEALGISLADLFDTPAVRSNGNGKSVIERTYPYVDENDELLFEVVRRQPKGFAQRRPDGRGGWVWNLGDVRRPLYNLPVVLAAVAAAVPIYVVEGEKDADALDRAGEIATCNPGGAGKWRPEHTGALTGASEVIIVADKDEPGRNHARQVADSIRSKVGAVRIVEAAIGKDAADHLGAGHTVDEFMPVDLDAEPDPTAEDAAAPSTGGLLRLQQLRGRALNPTQLDQLPPPEPLIDGILYLDTINALYGKPGIGKSFISNDWGLSVATGAWWLGHEVDQRPVIYVAAEGSAGLAQRKKAWETARSIVASDAPIVWLPLAVNLLDPEWIEGLALYGAELAAGLIVIDTASRSMPGGDEGARDMNRFVEALDQIRQATAACVLTVHHDTKAGDGTLRGHSSLEGAVNTAIIAQADGRSITLKCTKQKDAAAFEPIRLHLRPVGDSCAVYCRNSLPSPDELTESETAILDALGSAAGSDGLSAATLIKIAELPERSGYRAIKALVVRGVAINVGTEQRPRYTTKTEASR